MSLGEETAGGAGGLPILGILGHFPLGSASVRYEVLNRRSRRVRCGVLISDLGQYLPPISWVALLSSAAEALRPPTVTNERTATDSIGGPCMLIKLNEMAERKVSRAISGATNIRVGASRRMAIGIINYAQ